MLYRVKYVALAYTVMLGFLLLCDDYHGFGFSGGSIVVPAIQSAALQEFDAAAIRNVSSSSSLS
jgi:hypothetical protein